MVQPGHKAGGWLHLAGSHKAIPDLLAVDVVAHPLPRRTTRCAPDCLTTAACCLANSPSLAFRSTYATYYHESWNGQTGSEYDMALVILDSQARPCWVGVW